MKRLFLRISILFFILGVIASFIPVDSAQAAKKPSAIRSVSKKYVCLTVDDGWNKTKVTKILNTLRKFDVQCTFFIPGSRLKKYPDVWRQAVKDGHEICYHSMYHKSLRKMSSAGILADIKKWEDTVQKVLGADYNIPKLARLPGGSGNRDKRVLDVFAGRGYKVIGWNVDTLAHRKHVVSYIRKRVRAGCIILTHFTGYDGAALPKYLGWLKKKFNLVKLSEALDMTPPEEEPAPPPVEPSPGEPPAPPPSAEPEPAPPAEPEPSVEPVPPPVEPVPGETPAPSPPAGPEPETTAPPPDDGP